MIRKTLVTGMLGLLVMSSSGVFSAFAALDASSTLIVMPARARVIELAFQVARMKDVGLVAYNNNPNLAAPLVHVWNGREWLQIGMDEYTSGSFLPSRIAHVFILGDSIGLPAPMTVDPVWAGKTHKTADLSIANLLNRFNEVLKFSSMEWRWLAGKYGLKLTDHNAERRRYGRWGRDNVDRTIKPEAMPIPDVAPLPPVRDVSEPDRSKIPAVPAPAPVAVAAPAGPETVTAPVPAACEPEAPAAACAMPAPDPAEVVPAK